MIPLFRSFLPHPRVCRLFLGFLLSVAPGFNAALADEYFVSLQGADSQDGKSKETAFRTVQKGIQHLKPGDVLTIAPGEYAEAVVVQGLGNEDVETIIQAEIPGTVLLRGDRFVSPFEPVAGRRFTWVADLAEEPKAVNETDTLTSLNAAPLAEELEFAPGRYFYDKAAKKLYLSPSDLKHPQEHRYSVSVIGQTGMFLKEARRVTVRGIAATGFNTDKALPQPQGTAWGFWIQNSTGCRLVECTAYLNGGGLATYSRRHEKGLLGGDVTGEPFGGNNVIERCTAYANDSIFSPEGGNICAFQPNGDEIRDSRAFRSRSHGIRLYGNHYAESKLVGNIAWGHKLPDLWVKGQTVRLGSIENSISLGTLQAPDSPVRNCWVGGRNRSNAVNTIEVLQSGGMKGDEEFADAENLDFRLQSTSRFRKKNGEEKDRGPFAYQPDIFYVKADGEDTADGLSMKTAWKSLSHALGKMRPGDTLYLSPGRYDVPPEAITLPANVTIRGRSGGVAIIQGPLSVFPAGDALAFENLTFEGEVAVTKGRGIAFKNCVFNAPDASGLRAQDTADLRVTHCAFNGSSEAAITLEASPDAFLSSNAFENKEGVAVAFSGDSMPRYSDYNAYRTPQKAVRSGSEILSLADLQSLQRDRYSQAFEGGGNNAPGGRFGLPVGPYREKALAWSAMRWTVPAVHSVSSTTANIEWLASQPATYRIAWGVTPECENTASYDADSFASFSLSGLKPGQRYYWKIVAVVPPPSEGERPFEPIRTPPEPLEFVTAAEDLPARTLYVAEDGNDGNSGTSREEAWRTLQKAADAARPGDTVLVHDGTYTGTIRLRATGTKDRPITFRGATLPGKAIVEGGNRTLPVAFSLQSKSYIHVDGLYFTKFGYDPQPSSWPISYSKGIFTLYQGQGVRITRCFGDGRAGGAVYPPPFLKAYLSEDLLMENCVVLGGFVGLLFDQCAAVRLEHCVIIQPMIHAAVFQQTEAALCDSVVTDNKASKAKVWVLDVSSPSLFSEENNCFFLRIPDAERKFMSVGGWNPKPHRFSLDEFYAHVKKARSNSVFRDPRFRFAGEPQPAKGFSPDQVAGSSRSLSFGDFFVTEAGLKERRIGLVPEAFPEPVEVK